MALSSDKTVLEKSMNESVSSSSESQWSKSSGEASRSSSNVASLSSPIAVPSGYASPPTINQQMAATGSGRHQHLQTRLPNPPTFVDYRDMRFLVMDAPSENNIHLYVKEMEKHGVSDVVRVCDPTYPREILERQGIRVHDWIFPDGEGPPDAIVMMWLDLVAEKFAQVSVESLESTPHGCIAIHCVAGLGRAPVLVAIALI